MPTGYRNRSKYAEPNSDSESLENPESCTPEFLEKLWRAARKRDPIKDRYELPSDGGSLSGETIASALEMLWGSTGDEAFRTALLALRSYGLDAGGLKENLRRQMRGPHDVRPRSRAHSQRCIRGVAKSQKTSKRHD
jgi:hypothetical protein